MVMTYHRYSLAHILYYRFENYMLCKLHACCVLVLAISMAIDRNYLNVNIINVALYSDSLVIYLIIDCFIQLLFT